MPSPSNSNIPSSSEFLANLSSAPQAASYSWESNITTAPTSLTLDKSNYLTSSISPLAISFKVSENTLAALPNNETNNRAIVDGIIRELRVRGPSFRKRPVSQIHLRLPMDRLDITDLTELAYHLGQQFNVPNNPEAYNSVELTEAELNETNLALFKGLGFNAIHIRCDKGNTQPKRLVEIIELIESYKIKHLGLVTQTIDPDLPLRLRETMLPLDRLPSSIQLLESLTSVSANDDTPNDFKLFFQRLKDMGYRILGNDCFVHPNNPLAAAQNNNHLRRTYLGYNRQNITDVLGFGPGNFSQIDYKISSNPTRLDSYLKHSYAPCSIAQSDETSTLLKLVTDRLLCYHKLDLNYLKSRYNLDLNDTIEQLWSPIEELCGEQLYHLSDSQLSLSSSGILHLHPLCQALMFQGSQLFYSNKP